MDQVTEIVKETCPSHFRRSNSVTSGLVPTKKRKSDNNATTTTSSNLKSDHGLWPVTREGDSPLDEGVGLTSLISANNVHSNSTTEEYGVNRQTLNKPKFGRNRGRGNQVMMGDQPKPQATGAQAQRTRVKVSKNRPFLGIFVTFGRRMARFLNVKQSQYVLIGHFGFPTLNFPDYYLKLSPNFTKPKIEKMLIYCDIVSPNIQVGGQLTNLLDIISTPNSNIIHRAHIGGSYKPLKKHIIEEISIKSANIHDELLHFEKGAQTSYELHIRPLNE